MKKGGNWMESAMDIFAYRNHGLGLSGLCMEIRTDMRQHTSNHFLAIISPVMVVGGNS
jgi:hypothetical protein